MRFRELSGQVPGAQSDSAVRAVILDEMEAACPILEHAEFYTHTGNADAPIKNATANGGNVRAINSDYADNTTAPVYGSTALKVFGDKIQTDMAYQRRGIDVAGEHLRQIRSFARSLGRDLTNRFFNDTVAATTFNGLKALVPAGQKVQFDTVNGGDVPLGNATAEKKQQQKFLESLDNLIQLVRGGATVLYMDNKTLTRLRSIARDFVQVTAIQDAIGNPLVLTSYNGIPVRITGYKKDDSTLVIPHNETCGTGLTCTSVYAVRWTEKNDLTMATNVGLQAINKGVVGPHLTTWVDCDLDLVLLNDKSVARLEGVIIA